MQKAWASSSVIKRALTKPNRKKGVVKCLPAAIALETQQRFRPAVCAYVANQGHRLRDHGSDDAIGGLQEVISTEGSVLALSRDVLDIRHERVES